MASKRYKDDSKEVRAYAQKRDKELGVDREAQKKKEFEAQSKEQDRKMNVLSTMFRAGVGAITGNDSEEMKKLKKGLRGR